MTGCNLLSFGYFAALFITLSLTQTQAFLLPSTPSSASSTTSSIQNKQKITFNSQSSPLSLRFSPSSIPPLSSSTALSMSDADANNYWQGEWVCADCGYIYETKNFDYVYFEQQTRGFKCPQCSAPRRRFAKKVGDKVGITNDGGDAPIIAFSLIGGLATLAFGVYAALNF